MQETQRDVSLESEPLADSVRSCEFLLSAWPFVLLLGVSDRLASITTARPCGIKK